MPKRERKESGVTRTQEFVVSGDYIQLDQLLKVVGLVGSGGEAHAAVEAGLVRVDGKFESRKRAKLRTGQRVQFGGNELVLVSPGASPVDRG